MPPLEEEIGQVNESKPLIGRFKGLNAEISQAQMLFDIKVIDFDGPTLLIGLQYSPWRQLGVGRQEILRV